MVNVNLDVTYRYEGSYYGPGEKVAVPEKLAEALGLEPIKEPKKKAAKGDDKE